ncbi:MAG: DUF3341 domain-containing protein [Phycisphaerales bacterium]
MATMTTKMSEKGGAKPWGVLAEFETPGALMKACEKVRDAGYRKWDAFAPFPVHGLEKSMGLKPSRVSRFVLLGGLCGAGGGFLLQYWTSAVAYPMAVQGKPFGAWEPFTPVTFECGILLASFGAILGMLILNGLPRWHHPLFTRERFLGVSDDRFMLAIEARDAKYDPEGVRRLLESAGSTGVEFVSEE